MIGLVRGTTPTALLAVLVGGCVGPYREGDPEALEYPWADARLGAEVFYDEHELDEIEFDEDLERIFGDGIGDVERKRAGLRVTYGTEEVRAYAQIFGEEIDDFDQRELTPGTSLTIDDLWGIGLGVMGDPVLHWLDEETRLVFVYRADISFVTGEGTFRDTNPMTPLASGIEKDDVGYIDHQLLAGIGVDARGIRPALGVYSNFIAGGVDDGIVAGSSLDDLYFEAYNGGLFLELTYTPRYEYENFRAGVRATVGDVEGVEVFLSGTLRAPPSLH